jgi:hypothetical protein
MAEKKYSSKDLDNFIRNKAREYCAADPTRLAPCVRVPFQAWEARFFMRGLELGLFEVVSDGLLHYQRLSGHGPKARHTTGFVGYREVVTQFAALTKLIEEYGWPVENVLAEPPARGRANIYAFDGLVFDEARLGSGQARQSWPTVRIAIEAKINSAQVKKLMRVINKCVQRGFHERHDHPAGERSDHAKFLGIMEWKPAYFLTITPEEWIIYLVSWDNETRFSLAEVKHIPRFGPSEQS